jgi:hypothetical protein
MRQILEAEIAALEELAGQLKGLSEMKQRLAEDKEYPPHNAVQLRQKARKHRGEAIGVLTAVHTIKVAAAAATQAEQVALLRHYVLEFGQAASRKAKQSNSLEDDDPRKEDLDEEGTQDSFVVATLNRILNDITPSPEYIPPRAAAHLSMTGRLGQVLSWTANLVALAIVAFFLVLANGEPAHAGIIVSIGVAIAAVRRWVQC